jgi:hypothetical protein
MLVLFTAVAAAGNGGTVLEVAPVSGAADSTAAGGTGDAGAIFTRAGGGAVLVVEPFCWEVTAAGSAMTTEATGGRGGGIVDGPSSFGADGSMVLALVEY